MKINLSKFDLRKLFVIRFVGGWLGKLMTI